MSSVLWNLSGFCSTSVVEMILWELHVKQCALFTQIMLTILLKVCSCIIFGFPIESADNLPACSNMFMWGVRAWGVAFLQPSSRSIRHPFPISTLRPPWLLLCKYIKNLLQDRGNKHWVNEGGESLCSRCDYRWWCHSGRSLKQCLGWPRQRFETPAAMMTRRFCLLS